MLRKLLHVFTRCKVDASLFWCKSLCLGDEICILAQTCILERALSGILLSIGSCWFQHILNTQGPRARCYYHRSCSKCNRLFLHLKGLPPYASHCHGWEDSRSFASCGLLEKHVVIASALLEMYAKCGASSKAQRVLHDLSIWHVISWSALIARYAQ